jgi:hypothetical protein
MAFHWSGLQTIVIPPSVEVIGTQTFTACLWLVSMAFEEESRLHEVSGDAFQGCSFRDRIAFPSSCVAKHNE